MNYDKVPELPDVPATPAYRRGRVWLAVLLVACVAGAAAWWQFGRTLAPLTTKEKELAAQVTGLEDRLKVMRTKVNALPENSTQARRALLEEAVARQGELMRLRQPPAPTDAVRLSEWQAQLDDAIAMDLDRQSRELESAANELLHQKKPAAAGEKLIEALRLQREVNHGLSSRATKSYGREALLQQEVEELVAQPRLDEARKLLTDARASAAGGSRADALQLFTKAKEMQEQLNNDFPKSRFSDPQAIAQIEAEMAALGTGTTNPL